MAKLMWAGKCVTALRKTASHWIEWWKSKNRLLAIQAVHATERCCHNDHLPSRSHHCLQRHLSRLRSARRVLSQYPPQLSLMWNRVQCTEQHQDKVSEQAWWRKIARTDANQHKRATEFDYTQVAANFRAREIVGCDLKELMRSSQTGNRWHALHTL